MTGAVRKSLADGRWHFQHGPIDCIVSAEGTAGAAAECIERAWARFRTLLDELVAELPRLRADLSQPSAASLAPEGRVARRMLAACRPHAIDGRFITAMAAVAGSVAEELIASFDDPRIDRAYVNNGGDIALHLRGDSNFAIGVVADADADADAVRMALARAHACHPERSEGSRPPTGLGRFVIEASSPVRGIATSGWRGRSFSRGIADAVTVLARTASAADAAATVIANAVDIDAATIVRRPADEVRDDSDLGARLVTIAVPALPAREVDAALDAGVRQAAREIASGRIVAAILQLQGRVRVCGTIAVSASLSSLPEPVPSC